jgi:hypothetical protein
LKRNLLTNSFRYIHSWNYSFSWPSKNMEPQFRTRNRSVNLLEHKNQVKEGLGNEN